MLYGLRLSPSISGCLDASIAPPAPRHRGAALLIGVAGSLEQICVSGAFDLKPSQLPLRGERRGGVRVVVGRGADYRLLCFSNSFFFHFFRLIHPPLLPPEKLVLPPPSAFLRSRHSSVGGARKSHHARRGWWERLGRGSRRCDDSLRRRHYNRRHLLFPPPRRCVPSGPVAFILPRRDCN